MSRDLWLAMTTLMWDQQTTNIGYHLAERMSDGSIGYIPVFATEGEAKEAYPARAIVRVRAAVEDDA